LQITDQASSPPATKLPTRVLDVRNNSVRLIDSEDIIAWYTTLSHCWGADANDRPFTTTLASEAEVRHSISWSSLSKTFQDAIKITRSIGLDYIWIDSLCIIQDDPEDWQREAGKMAEVYSNSYLSIMNPRGVKPSSGCFTNRYLNRKTKFPALVEEPLRTAGTANGMEFEVFARPSIEHHEPYSRTNWVEWLPTEHIFSRAWVFQEYILAPRLILFGMSELVFFSMNGRACECAGFNSERSRQRFGFNREYFRELIMPSQTTRPVGRRGHKLWRDVVEAYAYRDLTQESDRLPALSGLAKRFRGSSEDQYLAGLWESCLIADLAWYPVTTVGQENSPDSLPHTTSSRTARYRAPTWSWASVTSRIKFWDFAYDEKETTAVLEEASCETNAIDSTGAVSGGFMVVTGPIREAILRYDLQGAGHPNSGHYWLETESNSDVAVDPPSEPGTRVWWRNFIPDIPLHDSSLEAYIANGGPVFCLQLGIRGSHGRMKRGSESVLVLTKLPTSDGYKRIGYWILDREQYYQEIGLTDSDVSWFDGCSRETITVE
jgi:hypothetical protein